jgi:hypothetical protein
MGDYLEKMLDLLVSLKSGFVNGVRVRTGRVHQLLGTGCVEPIHFVHHENGENIVDLSAYPIFAEIDSKVAHLKARSVKTQISPENRTYKEQDFLNLDDHALIQLISRHSVDALSAIAFAIATLQKRRGNAFKVQGGLIFRQFFDF